MIQMEGKLMPKIENSLSFEIKIKMKIKISFHVTNFNVENLLNLFPIEFEI